MARLTEAERAARARERLLETAKGMGPTAYKSRVVAPVFQQMIRAEYGADGVCNVAPAVVDGRIRYVPRQVGQVVCVTCGKVGPWSGGLGGMHTGHFIAGRGNSTLFDERGVACQCSRCNRYLNGAHSTFRVWMLAIRGLDVVEQLERLKNKSRKFTVDELVDMLIQFRARLKAAEKAMGEYA